MQGSGDLLLFAQLLLMLIAVRAVGFLGKRYFGQPQVVCEMVVGVLLGPSLLGHLIPEWHAVLFPPDSLDLIKAISNVGIVLYMYTVGLEFRTDLLTGKTATSLGVSIGGIVVPFVFAGILTTTLLAGNQYFPSQASWEVRWLFLGTAISITAFPVLARIISETGITRTSVGTIALGAGAVDDLVAWCVFALTLAAFTNDFSLAVSAIGGGAVFVLVSVFGFHKWFRKLYHSAEQRRVRDRRFEMSDGLIALLFIHMLFSACVTEALGIHAVFGAFMAGAIIPKGKLSELLTDKISPITINLFLPLFFVVSGFRVDLSALADGDGFQILAIIMAASVIGKFGVCSLVAYFGGEKLKGALCIGTLMNARGLMELILLNIGLSRGLITPSLFTALAIMAVLTTLMTTPLFNFIYRTLPGDFAAPKVKAPRPPQERRSAA